MASGVVVSGLDRLVEAVEAAEAAAAAANARLNARPPREGFMCPHPGCERLFSKRYNQQAHMRIHDGTRPFSCELCGKAFMWKSSLKSHAKMHAKMSAAEAASGTGKRAAGTQPDTLSRKRPAPAAITVKVGKDQPGVGKKKSKSSSPNHKKGRQGLKDVVMQEQRKAVAHSTTSSVPAVPLRLPPMDTHGSSLHETKPPTGRQSPNSVSRMDLETATLLTMFR